MRCLLFALIVACASTVWAETLPPVPKTISVPVSAVIKERIEPAPKPVKTESIKVEQSPCPVDQTPLPPASGKLATYGDSYVCCKCRRRPAETAIVFLGNELLRKPIYDVQKTLNELEGRRLCCEDRCLALEAERLARQAAELGEKAEQICPCDLHSQLRLLIEERNYAKKVNNLAVKQAALKCRKAHHRERTARLKAKYAELFHGCN